MPSTSTTNVPDNAPRPLDHFKRGYNERTELRDRETTVSSKKQSEILKFNLSPIQQSNQEKSPRDPKWLPPIVSDCIAQPHPNYNGPSSTSSNYSEQKSSISFNTNYNKYEDRQYTRNSSNHNCQQRQYKANNSRYNKGNISGFSMEAVVDRLCHPRSNVFEEMDHAHKTSSESFRSGRAITAILSQLGRRRQMRVAMQVWRWMENTNGITRNVFHYNALINVCEKIKDWKGALDLLRQMDVENVQKNEITYSSAISACEKGGNWRTALDLLKTMKDKRIMPTAIAYNAGDS